MSRAPQYWHKANVNGVACLVPGDEETEAWLKRRKFGDAVAMNPDHVRNAKQSKYYWVVCGIVAENHAELKDKDSVSDALQNLAGDVDVIMFTLPGGERIFQSRLRSLAFQSMKDEHFEAYMTRAFEIIESELLPGIDLEELRMEAVIRSGFNVSR